MIKKLWKKFALWLMGTAFYRWLLLNVIPFVRFSMYYTTLRGWKYIRGYRLLKPGHILLTVDKKKLTSILIPGDFSHAALCIDKGVEWEISEMTHKNYTKSAFFDLCKESDRVLILECTDWDAEYMEKVIRACRELDGVEYDVTFELGIEALYCSELIYKSDIEKRLQVSLEDLAGLGRPYLSPTGLMHAQNVRIVWDSDQETLV